MNAPTLWLAFRKIQLVTVVLGLSLLIWGYYMARSPAQLEEPYDVARHGEYVALFEQYAVGLTDEERFISLCIVIHSKLSTGKQTSPRPTLCKPGKWLVVGARRHLV